MVVGTKCPSISGLTWLKGGPIQIPLPDSDSGPGVLVLEFWATWCPPCKATIPHLTKLQAKYKDTVRFIGISTDEDAAKARQFVNQMGSAMEYAVALDTSKEGYQLMAAAGAHGIPHAFIVDRAGVIQYSGHPAEPTFEQTLQRAIAAAPAPAAQELEALPLVTESFEELMKRGLKELKTLLVDRGISTADCLEKADLAKKITETCATVTYFKKR